MTKDKRISEQSPKDVWDIGPYFVAWGLVLLLTGVTYGLSHMPLGTYALPVAIVIAATQAAIVALWFMHLKNETGAVPLTLGIVVVFFGLLLALSLVDVTTRFVPARPFENVHGPSPTLFPAHSDR